MRILICILLGVLPLLSFGQPLPDRYLTEVFTTVTETPNQLFSEDVPQPTPGGGWYELLSGYPLNADETVTVPVDLYMDIFEPTGDTLTNRPAIVICFGGGFLGGSRDHWSIRLLAEELAKRGFVTAAIDYRLGMNIFDADLSTRAVYRGIQDGRAAVKYLRANAATYGIDPNEVYIGGHSAGAFIALHNLYLDKETERPLSTYEWIQDGDSIPDLGCLDCTGVEGEISGHADCAFSLAGAVGFTSYIETADDRQTSMFHSTDDDTVPYDSGEPFSSITILVIGSDLPVVYGSLPISQRCDSVSLPDTLHSYTDRGHGVHEAPGDTELYPDIIPRIGSWFHAQRLKPEEHLLIGSGVVCAGQLTQTYTIETSDAVYFDWQITGGTFISQSSTSNVAVVNWSDSASMRTISVTPYNVYAARGTLQERDVILVGEGENVWLGGTGNWHNASKWSLGHAPVRCENVLISHTGSLITIDIDANTIVQLKSLETVGDVEVTLGIGSDVRVE